MRPRDQISRRRTLSGTFRTALIALAATVLWPSLGIAQDTSDLVESASLTTDADFDDDNVSGRIWTANIETCRDLLGDDDELTFQWVLRNSYSDQDLRYAIKLERPDGECDTTSAGQENSEACEFIASNERVGSSTQFEVDVRPSRIFDLTSPDDCFTEIDGAYDMILVAPLVTVLDDEDSHEPDVIRVRLDTERPTPPPGEVDVRGGESRIDVDWSEATEADAYRIYASTTPFSAGALPEVIEDARSARVTGTEGAITSGISANNTYYVGVVAIDSSGNESVVSAVSVISTQPTQDFWEAYRTAGGIEDGGHCSSVGGGAAPIGAAILLLIGLLRRREER